MESRPRRTSGLLVAVAVLAGVFLAGLSGPPPADAAVGECPPGYEPVGPIDSGDPGFPPYTDDNVNVFAGGSFSVVEEAAEAEGRVVVLDDASFTRATTGTYNVGVVGVGSGIVPPPGSTMLAVGGDLDGNTATRLDVGAGIGGDVAVGGSIDDDLVVETNGGSLDQGVADATAAYAGTPGLIAAKSAAWAALETTGEVDVQPFALTATGDGVSDPQVFRIDGAELTGGTRSLQLVDVPDDAQVVITLTGPAVDLDLNALLSAGGTIVDPSTGPFVDVTTRLVWNVPTATSVGIGGSAQVPGSIVVADPASTTTITAPGTNGRVWVAGDLVHGGVGAEMHAYPLDPDDDLECKPLVGAVSVDKVLDDPDDVVPTGRVFTGTVSCTRDGDDVTPDPASWSVTAGEGPVVLADDVPVGAVCTLVEDTLTTPPGDGYEWGPVVIAPTSVVVEDEAVLGFTVTNEARPTTPPTTDPPTTTPPTTDPPTTTPPTTHPPTTDPPTTPPTADPTTESPTGSPSPTATPTQSPTDPPTVGPDSDGDLPDTGAPSGLFLMGAVAAGFVLAGLLLVATSRRGAGRRG